MRPRPSRSLPRPRYLRLDRVDLRLDRVDLRLDCLDPHLDLRSQCCEIQLSGVNRQRPARSSSSVDTTHEDRVKVEEIKVEIKIVEAKIDAVEADTERGRIRTQRDEPGAERIGSTS